MIRTDPHDVARVEAKTYICTETRAESNSPREDVKSRLGNWMKVDEMEQKLGERFPNCMKGNCNILF